MRLLPHNSIAPNSYNANEMAPGKFSALVANMRRVGFVQPILVVPAEDEDGYIIVDGEHRWRAASVADIDQIPAVIVHLPLHEAMAQTLALNELRGSSNEAQVGDIVRDLTEAGLTYADLATFTGYGEQDLIDFAALADFEFPQATAVPDTSPAPMPTASGEDEAWVSVSWRLPESIALQLTGELDRLGSILGGDVKLHTAVELMVACSANTPAANVLGE